MEIKDIILASLLFLVIISNTIVSYINGRIYKQKTKLINERLKYVSELYLPLLLVIRDYYAEKEEYLKAKEIQDLMKMVVETDKSITNN